MGNLIPASGGSNSFVEKRETRAVGVAIGRLERSTELGLARVEQQALLESSRVQAVSYVGQQAMQAVAMVSQLEGQLGAACPLAVTRLQGLADITALAIANVVSDSARKIGR